MNALRSVCSRSRGDGDCLSRKLAITPRSSTTVLSVSRMASQNSAVRNSGTIAIDPP
ncbi:hypothetical protein D3C87_2166010 [compost metagenome]